MIDNAKHVCINFHFLKVLFVTHSERLHAWLNRFFESYDQGHKFPLEQGTYRVFVEEMGTPDQLAFEAITGAFANMSLIMAPCFSRGGILFSEKNETDLKHQCRVDTRERAAYINVGGGLAGSEELFLYCVIRNLLSTIVFRFSRLIPLHAAVVTGRGRTIMLSGPRGMGKSTLALKLVERGYSILSDDSPLFTFIDGRTVALSSLDLLSVADDTLSLLPSLRPMAIQRRDVSGKLLLDRRRFPDGTLAYGPCQVTDFISLVRGSVARAGIRCDENIRVTQTLLKESMLLFNKFDHPSPAVINQSHSFQFETISNLLSCARSYILEYPSGNLDDIADTLECGLGLTASESSVIG